MSTQNVNVARFARNVEWDFFCDFQTPCLLSYSLSKSTKRWFGLIHQCSITVKYMTNICHFALKAFVFKVFKHSGIHHQNYSRRYTHFKVNICLVCDYSSNQIVNRMCQCEASSRRPHKITMKLAKCHVKHFIYTTIETTRTYP